MIFIIGVQYELMAMEIFICLDTQYTLHRFIISKKVYDLGKKMYKWIIDGVSHLNAEIYFLFFKITVANHKEIYGLIVITYDVDNFF